MIGVGAEPMDTVGGACAKVYRWVGISLLPRRVPLIQITNEVWLASAWVAVVCGLFGIIFQTLSEAVIKGLAFRPISYFTLFTGLMCLMGVHMSAKLGNVTSASARSCQPSPVFGPSAL